MWDGVYMCVWLGAGPPSVMTPPACKSTSAPSVVTPPRSSTSALSVVTPPACGSTSAEFNISASHSLGKFIITITMHCFGFFQEGVGEGHPPLE